MSLSRYFLTGLACIIGCTRTFGLAADEPIQVPVKFAAQTNVNVNTTPPQVSIAFYGWMNQTVTNGFLQTVADCSVSVSLNNQTSSGSNPNSGGDEPPPIYGNTVTATLNAEQSYNVTLNAYTNCSHAQGCCGVIFSAPPPGYAVLINGVVQTGNPIQFEVCPQSPNVNTSFTITLHQVDYSQTSVEVPFYAWSGWWPNSGFSATNSATLDGLNSTTQSPTNWDSSQYKVFGTTVNPTLSVGTSYELDINASTTPTSSAEYHGIVFTQPAGYNLIIDGTAQTQLVYGNQTGPHTVVLQPNGSAPPPVYYNGSVTATLTDQVATVSGEANSIATPVETSFLEIGKRYNLTVTATNANGGQVIVTPPPGYILLIDGAETNEINFAGAGGTYTVSVVPPLDPFSGEAGTASSFVGGQVKWRVALGSLKNGEPAGNISIIGAGTSDWSAFYTPTALCCEPTAPSEIYVYRPDGITVGQVSANEAFVNVVTLTATSYELDFYSPSQAQGSSYPKTLTGQPFVTYLVQQDGSNPTELLITKQTYASSSSSTVVRSEQTTLQRTGTDKTNFVWTVSDWTLTGQTPVSREIRTWTGNASGGHDETTQVLAADGTVAAQSTCSYTGFTWGDTPTSDTTGTTNPLASTYTFNTDATSPGSYGFTQQEQTNGGNWELYTYFPTNNILEVGTISTTYQPYLNAPTAPTPGTYPVGGKVTSFTYDHDAFGLLRRLKTSVTTINGSTTSSATINYTTSTVNGMTVVTATRQDQTDAAGHTLTSVHEYYQEDAADDFYRNQTHSMTKPDGTKQSFVRQHGTFDGTTFSTSSDTGATRIAVISGVSSSTTGATLISSYQSYTIDPIYVIADRSTMTTTIRDVSARVVRTENYVWDGANWQLVTWVNFGYNWANKLVSTTSSNGDISSAIYTGALKTSETDASGITTLYDYDSAGRVWHVTKQGVSPAPNLITAFTYDATGAVTQEDTYAQGGNEHLISTHFYDLAGRVTSETSPGVAATTYSYDPVNLLKTSTHPDGGTRIETSFPDGQLASVTGTGVVPEYYAYTMGTDGIRLLQINEGQSNSSRLRKVSTDWLGRTVKIDRPGFTGQPDYIEQNTYSTTTGQLIRTDRTGAASTYYQYNAMGQLVLSGLDVNNNGQLDLASTDRISGQDTLFANQSGNWWLTTQSYTYATANSATQTITGSKQVRLTGFTGNSTGAYVDAEVDSTDAYGNTTIQTTTVNQTASTVTTTTTLPGLANSEVDVATNGLALSKATPDGLTFTTGYDGLQRQVSSVDPRTGTSSIGYVPGTTLPLTIQDARQVTVATYTYDNLGRKSTTTDAAGHITRLAYNLQGQILDQWGDGAYPVSYGYDTYGERTQFYTYQTENNWASATWPGGTVTPTSTTTWNYDGPSGLLTSKTDAANRTVSFDYNSAGRTAHRYLARTLANGSTPVTATYTYDSMTGDLLSTAYNDGTPAVSTTYDRLAQPATIADATGTRTINPDATLPWQVDSVTLPAFYQNDVVTRLYETTTNSATGMVKGHYRGFQLGTAATPAALLEQTFASNSLGQFASLASSRASDTVSQSFGYLYVPNSELVQSLSATGTPFVLGRAYEPHRNLLTGIAAQWNAATPSNYTYQYNDLGQRTSVTQSGSAFSEYGAPTGQNFSYDARGELTSATGYLGSSAALPGRQFQFAYDAAGNRTSANHSSQSGSTDQFSVNALNELTGRQNHSVSVSGTVGPGVFTVVNNAETNHQGNFWQYDATLPSGNPGPVTEQVPVDAILPGGGSSNNDLAQENSLSVFLAPAAELLAYDFDGNLTSDGKWTYTWDAENRLISMQTNSAAVAAGAANQLLQFAYDYLGRRVDKQVSTWNASTSSFQLSTETRFLYDDWNLVAEFSVQSSTLSLSRSYTWGLDLSGSLTTTGGVGALLQVTDYATGTSYFPTYDGNGNVAALLNAATGVVAASYEYNAFGEPLRTSGSYAHANPIRFSSKFTDDETGLVYYGHRYYNARNGRFINRDPSEEAGGLNLYGFCANDAVNGYDRLGLDDENMGGQEGDPGKDPFGPVIVLPPFIVNGNDPPPGLDVISAEELQQQLDAGDNYNYFYSGGKYYVESGSSGGNTPKSTPNSQVPGTGTSAKANSSLAAPNRPSSSANPSGTPPPSSIATSGSLGDGDQRWKGVPYAYNPNTGMSSAPNTTEGPNWAPLPYVLFVAPALYYTIPYIMENGSALFLATNLALMPTTATFEEPPSEPVEPEIYQSSNEATAADASGEATASETTAAGTTGAGTGTTTGAAAASETTAAGSTVVETTVEAGAADEVVEGVVVVIFLPAGF